MASLTGQALAFHFSKTLFLNVGFEVLTAVVMKSTIFWDKLATGFHAGFLLSLFFRP
jgi:hypothetical protein